jgi:uncharacterized protein YfaS (alpha-2-macroglobulin family)
MNNTKKSSVLVVLLLILLFVSGCGKKATTPPEGAPAKPVELVDDGHPLSPSVIGQDPPLGEETPLDSDLVIYFDQAMDTEVTASVFELIGPDGDSIAGQITWPDERTLQFDPAEDLLPDGTYEAVVGTGATSAEGVSLDVERSILFSTLTTLQVTQVFPLDGATGVEASSLITAMFNRPVVPLATSQDQANQVQPLSISPQVAGQGEWLNTSTYIFRPDEPLVGNTTYSVSVPAGLRDVSGSDESQLAQSVSWKFTTEAPSVDRIAVPDLITHPQDYYSDMPLNATFSIRFRQPMDQSSTQSAFSLMSNDYRRVAGRFAWDEENMEMIFTPTSRLELGTGYSLILDNSAEALEGGTLKEGLVWHFYTVFYPAIVRVTPANGQVQNYYSDQFEIEFASPMDKDTLENRVIITPRPEGELSWNYYNRRMTIFGLEPSTSYQVRILSGMADPHGNTIRESMTVNFITAAREPLAWLQMPGEYTLLRAQGDHDVYLRYVNVDTVQFSLYPIDIKNLVNFKAEGTSTVDYRPFPSSVIHSWTETITGPRDEYNLEKIELRDSEGKSLSPGMYFLGITSKDITHTSLWLDARIFIVATDNMTIKTTLSDALVWLTDLESGEPVEDATINVYEYEETLGPIGGGKTDADGLATIDLPVPEGRYLERFYIAQGNGHFAFGQNYMGIDVYPGDYGIYTNYYLIPDQPSLYIYTDRPLYRPGQPVYFKGIVRMNDDLDYSLPAEEKVEVTISNYDEVIFEKTLPLSSFGSFDGELTLDSEATLGYYTIQVRFPGEEETIGSRSFNVAEYHKPEFEVDVTTTESHLLDGDTLEATVQADFYSGGAVANAQVDWILYAEPYFFQGTGEYSRYQFYDFESDIYFSYYEPYGSGKVIAEGEGVTDENGELQITIPIDLSELGFSQRLTLEASVTDLTGNAVSNRTQVLAHWSEFYIGARAQQYVGRADEEQTFDLIVLDWFGNPIANQTLSAEIAERRWNSVQEIDEFGRSVWTSSVEEIPVTGSIETSTDGEGRASVSFVPPNGGVYKLKVTGLDSRGTEARTSAYLWVSGSGYIPWRRTNDHSLRLVSDSDSYAPGDTAEILITSPFQGSVYALVTVERGHVRSANVIELKQNSTIYELPITADMAPNVYFSVVLMKGVDKTSPLPDYRMGLIEVNVDTLEQALNIEITPDTDEAGPGDRVTYSVVATDHAGKPVHAELSFSLVDLALLALTDPNAPPIIDYFYNTRSLTVFTAMPLTMSIDTYNEEIVEHAKGGGGGGGNGGVIEVRGDFPDTAYWKARVVTDENGEASVTVTLPDNLTTWRMDTRAITEDTLVGENTIDIISTKPLLVRPQTPRFFVAGDEVTLGMAVHNNTGRNVAPAVSLEGEGLQIESPARSYVYIRDGEQAYVEWQVRIDDDAERVDLVFSASSAEYSDASRPTLGTLDGQGIPVYRYEVPETVGTGGQLTEAGSRTEAISLPVYPNYEITEGYVSIRLTPSLAAGFTDGLTYLEHFPYECTEQIISRFLPNVVTMRTLKAAGISDHELEANLDEQINYALQRLYNQQHADGGWGWWSTTESNALTTAYVVQGLIEADASGYEISSNVLEDALLYLQEQLQPVESFEATYLLNRQAYILYVLASADRAAVSQTVKLYEARQSLDLYARAYLAQTLSMIDDDDPRLDTMISDFVSEAALSATGTHWNEAQRDYWNWNTDTRTTAIILDTILRIDPDNSLNASTVRWLMANRSQGRWRGTQETVWALLALNRWARISGDLEPDYLFETALNGESLGGGVANTETMRATTDYLVNLEDLNIDGINRLTIARNAGPGNLYYTSHLMISMPVEEVQAFSQGITITRSYFQPDDRNTAITSILQGENFLARLTIVVPDSLHYVIIEDYLPAGLEAISESLNTSPQQSAPPRYDYNDVRTSGWGWWYFDHVELRDEKIVISADYLPAGVYEYIYLVRASMPGIYHVIPPTGQEFYFPEVYGRGEGSLFEVTQ